MKNKKTEIKAKIRVVVGPSPIRWGNGLITDRRYIFE